MFSIKFRNPKKRQVLVFDREGSEILGMMVLEGIDHEVLPSRYEMFYLTPQIILGILLNLRHVQITQLKGIRDLTKPVRQLLGSLYRIYLLSCVQYVQPKIVVTFIDNSYAYQFVSRRYKEAYFLAIENGIRCRGDLRDWLPPLGEPGSTISMPVLCCFGEYEKDFYHQYDHQVDVFYPVGSLRAGYYRTPVANKIQEKEFDLCLISQWHDRIMTGEHLPAIGNGLRMLDDYLKKYLSEHKLTCCVALRSGEPEEEQYFINHYGSLAHLVKSDKKNMSSYRAIDKSSAVVALDSTLAREAFGWGAKVLFCNFSGDELYTFPTEGFWSITELGYDSFKERLEYILSLEQEEYHYRTKACAKYVMNNDVKKPAHEYIRELISKQLVS